MSPPYGVAARLPLRVKSLECSQTLATAANE